MRKSWHGAASTVREVDPAVGEMLKVLHEDVLEEVQVHRDGYGRGENVKASDGGLSLLLIVDQFRKARQFVLGLNAT